MNPILFGSRDRQLFGVHVPAHGKRRRNGAVICAPWGQEYERSHRACRLLGDRLAANGYDVLRFDYYGTGDSAGSREAITFNGCVQDTLSAVEEICALANVRRVLLVGLRLGAAIADRAAAEARSIDRLVLWDPVSDGREYLNSLLAGTTDHRVHQRMRHLRGFPLPRGVEEELQAIDPESFAKGRLRKVLLIASEEQRHIQLLSHLRRSQEGVDWELFEAPQSWVEEGYLGAGAIPVGILDHIANWEE